MAVELDSITQTEFISSGRYLAKLCDYVPYMIFDSKSLIALKVPFAAYRSLFDILSLILQRNEGRKSPTCCIPCRSKMVANRAINVLLLGLTFGPWAQFYWALFPNRC